MKAVQRNHTIQSVQCNLGFSNCYGIKILSAIVKHQDLYIQVLQDSSMDNVNENKQILILVVSEGSPFDGNYWEYIGSVLTDNGYRTLHVLSHTK